MLIASSRVEQYQVCLKIPSSNIHKIPTSIPYSLIPSLGTRLHFTVYSTMPYCRDPCCWKNWIQVLWKHMGRNVQVANPGLNTSQH